MDWFSLKVVSRGVSAVLAVALFLSWTGPAAAQRAAARDQKKIPDPETITLETDDGLAMTATFYGSIEGKNAVPIILLHGYKGDRRDFDQLALYLQQLGHAVIAPDLRGHGDSKSITPPGSASSITVDAARLRKDDFIAMAGRYGEVERAKRYLMSKNNAGELNIEKLCVIGADMGATVALYWTQRDWGLPVLPSGKQGQDVKGLVLISPQWSFKGLPITVPINFPPIQREISVMIVVGRGDTSSMRDATRIHKIMEKVRPEPPSDPLKVAEKQDLFFDEQPTSLSGTRMLGEKSLGLNARIAKFIELRLVNKKFPWTNRSSKINSD